MVKQKKSSETIYSLMKLPLVGATAGSKKKSNESKTAVKGATTQYIGKEWNNSYISEGTRFALKVER